MTHGPIPRKGSTIRGSRLKESWTPATEALEVGGIAVWEDCAMTGTPNNNMEAARASKLALVVLIISSPNSLTLLFKHYPHKTHPLPGWGGDAQVGLLQATSSSGSIVRLR